MGWSSSHAASVAVVRNLMTGNLSPQFHVVFDPWFETVSEQGDDITPATWDVLVTNYRHENEFDSEDLPDRHLHDDWLSKEELLEKRTQEAQKRASMMRPKRNGRQQTEVEETSTNTEMMPQESDVVHSSEGATRSRTPSIPTGSGKGSSTTSPTNSRLEQVDEAEMDSPNLQRRGFGKRIRLPATHMNISTTHTKSYFATYDRVRQLQEENRWTQRSALAHWVLESMDPEGGYIDVSEPDMTLRAYKATTKGLNPDLPNYRQAMEGPHVAEFKEAMRKEIESLISWGTWQAVIRKTLPDGAEIVPLTWVYRIKRLPNGEFCKFKARLCVRGDLMNDDVETYAPTVKFSTIRTVLAFALRMKLITKQIDFSNAFVQAELGEREKLYVTLPPGVHHPTRDNKEVVLQLKKSLYGQKDAPRLWYKKVKAGIENLGFVSSEADPCLFLHKKKKILLLLYVDDVLLFNEKEEVLQQVIDDLKRGFSLTEEDLGKRDAFAYLGIELQFNGTKVTMTQDGLMEKVFRTTKWEDINGSKTPAQPRALGADLQGVPFNAEWEYASVVGMLMFLVNTRPDIQFAVYQCARFTHSPKMSHLKAVKRIVRYLKGTAVNGKDRGLTFDTGIKGQQLQADCYVDADFAGLFNVEHNDDPVSSKSRSGFVIFLGNCPII